jgi:hypothetical protein
MYGYATGPKWPDYLAWGTADGIGPDAEFRPCAPLRDKSAVLEPRLNVRPVTIVGVVPAMNVRRANDFN